MPSDRTKLSKPSYQDTDDFYRDLHLAGGPGYDDLGHLGGGQGFHSELLRAIWGATEEEFVQSLIYEQAREQFQRPHAFVRKWQARRRKRK